MVWTSELEDALLHMLQCAKARSWTHRQEAKAFEKWDSALSNSDMIIPTVIGLLSTVSLNVGLESTKPMIITVAVLGYLSSAIKAYVRTKKFETIIRDYKNTASNYDRVAEDIARQLTLRRDEREDSNDFHRWISKDYNNLEQTVMHVSELVFKQYQDMCDKNKMENPLEKLRSVAIHKISRSLSDHSPVQQGDSTPSNMVSVSVIEMGAPAAPSDPAPKDAGIVPKDAVPAPKRDPPTVEMSEAKESKEDKPRHSKSKRKKSSKTHGK